MTTLQPFQCHLQRIVICGRRLAGGLAGESDKIAACGGIAEGAEPLPIQIDQIISIQILRRHIHRCHTVLFIDGDDHPQRAVPQGRVLQDVEAKRHADPIVSPQAGTIRAERFPVVDDLDRVIQRVKVNAFCRHTDHIHMGLQDHLRRLFISCGGRLVNDDIAELIPDSGQAMASGPVHEIVADLLLVM